MMSSTLATPTVNEEKDVPSLSLPASSVHRSQLIERIPRQAAGRSAPMSYLKNSAIAVSPVTVARRGSFRRSSTVAR